MLDDEPCSDEAQDAPQEPTDSREVIAAPYTILKHAVPDQFDFKPNAYEYKKGTTEHIYNPVQASKKQSRDMAFLKEVAKRCGDLPHVSQLLHSFSIKQEPAVGISLGMSDDPIRSRIVANMTKEQIKQILNSEGVHGSNSVDAMTFKDIVFLAIAPQAPPAGSDKETKKAYRKL